MGGAVILPQVSTVQGSAPGVSACGSPASAPVTVLFVNGIWNSASEALQSCTKVGDVLRSTPVGSYQLNLFYNRAVDDAWADCLSAIQDATSRQTAGQTIDWVEVRRSRNNLVHNNSGVSPLTGSVAEDAVKVPRQAVEDGCVQDEDLFEAWKQLQNVRGGYLKSPAADAVRLRAAIRAELASGRRLVVVAHSQGNLLFQEAVFGPGGLTVAERHQVSWVALAAPHMQADPDLADFESILLALDPIAIPGQNQTAVVHPIAGPADLDQMFSRHLLDTYLTQTDALSRIQGAFRRMVGPANPPNDATVTQAPSRVLLVLDLSSSMNSAGRLDAAKASADRLLQELPAATEVGVVTFGGQCEVSGGTGFTSDLAALRGRVAQLVANGSTPLALAMNQAATLTRSLAATGGVSVVVLTDGEETCRGDVDAAAKALGQALGLPAGGGSN